MRTIGFSTGALAYSDFRWGLAMVSKIGLRALELSALRELELEPLLAALDSLDLETFRYISIHAPSQFSGSSERHIQSLLAKQLWRRWPIILHPDAITDFGMWRDLGPILSVENMDKRKPVGRSRRELDRIFKELPDARFCFDIGHARQFDPTMTEAYLILREFGSRLTQVHVSEVNSRSKHDRLSYASIMAFQEVANLIPPEIPLILETPVSSCEIEPEIARVERALPISSEVMVA
jgi:hypothetical protein